MAFDLKDLRCMEASCTDSADGAVMFAAGVLYYFATKEAKSLVWATGIARRFLRGRLGFVAAGQTAVRLMLKTWMKQTGIQNVGDFYIGHQLHNPRNVLKLSTKVSMAVSDRFCMVKMVHLCHSAKFHDQTG